ncbi:hemin uptake protein HemP [Variovorax sp. VNK109]|uniref:hemin uptake protein HemP n=1 Tax=Variovorax sp. VNK109 TaxID=3400919 RepID=UPI003C0154CF
MPGLTSQEGMLRSGGDGVAGTTLDSSELLRGNKAVTIQHNGSVYRLQSTKLGKLILTK